MLFQWVLKFPIPIQIVTNGIINYLSPLLPKTKFKILSSILWCTVALTFYKLRLFCSAFEGGGEHPNTIVVLLPLWSHVYSRVSQIYIFSDHCEMATVKEDLPTMWKERSEFQNLSAQIGAISIHIPLHLPPCTANAFKITDSCCAGIAS